MSLNPVQFGKDVIDQFGRYLLTTFPVADERLAGQVKERLAFQVSGESLLFKGPYVYLNRPFEPGPTLADLIASGAFHGAMTSVFAHERLHYHQAEAINAVQAGRNLILSTGTGSGKTEAFTLPIINHCLHMRDRNAPPGIVAIIVYPMNALVNDQLDRLRWTLAGTGVTFGRYTGETERTPQDDVHQQDAPVPYTATQKAAYRDSGVTFGSQALPLPYEECFDAPAIRARQPRILLTNYAQLEYLLLRDKDVQLFRDAPLRFMVFDEVHTYTGALGSEVACLVRRLRDVARKSSDEVTMIGTSATVSDDPDGAAAQIDTEAMTRRFAHRLFGVPEDSIQVVRESYRELQPRETYLPPLPDAMLTLLDDLLTATRRLQLQPELSADDIPAHLVELTAQLCQKSPSSAAPDNPLAGLLDSNRCIMYLADIFEQPVTWDEALPQWRQLSDDRRSASREHLIAEMLAYLTLGALVDVDGDPLLRPKLHYFVQGLQGLGIKFSAHTPVPHISFSENDDIPPLMLCRSCGQHYTRLIAAEWESANRSRYGYCVTRVPGQFEEPQPDSTWLYLTDRFHTEDDENSRDNWHRVYLCAVCETVHRKNEPQCLNPQCRTADAMIALLAYKPDDGGIPTRCPACSAPNTEKSRQISHTRSATVADVTILAQSMLTMMTESSLRKVLIFADSRQDAAFQAGWMQERSKRFRLRHIAYQVVKESGRIFNWQDFTQEIMLRAQSAGILPRRAFNDENNLTYIRWFLIEEFAFVTQRRSNLEQLGLLEVVYDGFQQPDHLFFREWADQLALQPGDIQAVTQIILDNFRRRGVLSEGLLSRWWNPQDIEVFNSLISVPDYYRPSALVKHKRGSQSFVRGLIASNGRASAQVIVSKALPNIGPKTRDRFLEALWEWLIQADYLSDVELVSRRRGTVSAVPNQPDHLYQVNVDVIGIRRTQSRYVCTHCHRAQQVMTPTGNCPEYSCSGTLERNDRDDEHYDVVQYERQEFVPMQVREHSAQVPRKNRLEAEREFKNEQGQVNAIVATPTLEMGVDIGKLEMVLMRNVPPTPANYAQRAGRAGRRHRIGVVFNYAGSSQHDRYFYASPPEAIAGDVRVPAFSMQNEPLIRKHVHSTVLTALREAVSDAEQAILRAAFPRYIRDYLVEWETSGDRTRMRFLTAAPTFPDLAGLIKSHRKLLIDRLVNVFVSDWPTDDGHAVERDRLRRYLDEMVTRLEQQIKLLFNQVKAYRDGLTELRRIEATDGSLQADEKKTRHRLEQARDNYLDKSIDNYTLSWLATNGFFPGYALSRESVQATSIEPLLEITRPAAVALRELTPANWIYADSHIFSVERLNFGKLRASDAAFSSDMLLETMEFDEHLGRLYLPEMEQTEGGNRQARPVQSYQLVDVEMKQIQNIDDRQELRRRVPFDIHGLLLNLHRGGRGGRAGEKKFQYLRQESVRLVNLGPTYTGPTGIQGFPLCSICGATRSPNSTEVEIDRFRDIHRERCNVSDIQFTALHVELKSDVLRLGPYPARQDAVNTYEGLLAGARAVLDMGGDELDGFFYMDERESVHAVIYDPLPGGTGFIDQLLTYWQTVCEAGMDALRRCDCKSSCYKCMQHFRNQMYHDSLDRFQAIELLAALNGDIYSDNEIAPRVDDATSEKPDTKTESPAEEKFLEVLREAGFPDPPVAQHRVDLKNGNYTVADFAWLDERVLVFIDGTSEHLHGNPQTARRDRLRRVQARMNNWHVIEMTYQELFDEEALALKLDELTIYLSGGA